MATANFELNDEAIEALATAIAAKLGGSDKPAKTSKAKSNDDDGDDGDENLVEKMKELCAEFKKENSAADLKELLEEFDVKTPASAAKLDEEELAELVETLEEELGGDDDDDDDDDDDADRTVDEVKKLCQAFQKAEGKEELTELLEEYDIKKVTELKKLEQEDLNELFDELTEELE